MWTNGNICSFLKTCFPRLVIDWLSDPACLKPASLHVTATSCRAQKKNKIKKLVSKIKHSCSLPQWLHPARKADFVTLETLQEANFKTFLQIMLETIYSTIDRLVGGLQDLKTSLQYSQKDFPLTQ